MTEPTATAPVCEFEMDDPGPHPGCSEFDPDPGTIGCNATATHLVTFPDGPEGPESVAFCAFHRDLVTAEEPDATSVPLEGDEPAIPDPPAPPLATFVYVVEGEPHVGTVRDLARALDEANMAGLEVGPFVYTVDREGGHLEPTPYTTAGTPYNEDDYATVTVTVPLAGGPQTATYRVDGRA